MIKVWSMYRILEGHWYDSSIKNDPFFDSTRPNDFKFASLYCSVTIFIMERLVSDKIRTVDEAMITAS